VDGPGKEQQAGGHNHQPAEPAETGERQAAEWSPGKTENE
jgi:hypothetical protein